MTQKNDFLSLLKRNNAASTGEISRLKFPEALRLQISVIDHNVCLGLVDIKGKVVSPQDYESAGTLGAMISALKDLSSRSLLDFVWNETPADIFSLKDFPFLAQYLESCKDFLVDGDMRPLSFDAEQKKTHFVIQKNNDVYQGSFKIGEHVVDNFISPTLALAADTIVSTIDVGPRYADICVLAEPFDTDMLDVFLSIFFSTVSNIALDFDNRKIVFVDEVKQMTPVLVIEKIDSDKSLIMRVSEMAGSLPMDICENFSLQRIAYVTDREVVVRKLGESTIEHGIEILLQSLKENASGRKEQREIWNEANRFIVPEHIASRFLFNSFAKLINEFRIVGAEKLKSYKIVAAKPKLNLRLSSGIDFLEGKASVDIAGQQFTLRDILSQFSKNRYVTLSDGNRAVLDSIYMRRLERIFRNNAKQGEDVKISFFDLPEVMELLDDNEKSQKSFDTYRKFYEGFNSLGEKKLKTPGLKAKLRSYQTEGVNWINYLHDTGMGGCLADDMGLGKTVQTIAMLTRTVASASNPALIVMPRSLLFNWQEEFKKFAPKISVSTHYGPARNLDEAMKAQVVLTSYAMVRNDIEQFMTKEFDYVILDESQNIKNVDAQVTKAVWLLKGKHRLAISGTPIENNLSELYSLFRFLNPAMFGPLKDFTAEYVAPIQRDGDEDAATALRRKVFPFILRRLKKDVLTDLPERTEQVLTVEMSSRQAALYEERRQYYDEVIKHTLSTAGANKASFELLQALSELRQIASIPEEKSNGSIRSPKIELLMENLLAAVENGHKVVVFFNFLAGIELTAEKLENHGIGYEIMTGATANRQKVVDRFQNDDECRVMLMTIKTGGVGLNLVAADTVFVVEPWWNKAAEEQAINRLHRIGQKNAVNCYFLITADTIEEKIRQLQEKKSALVDAVISSDTAGGKNLSADDISFLLSKS